MDQASIYLFMGGVVQLVEFVFCIYEVVGSCPTISSVAGDSFLSLPRAKRVKKNKGRRSRIASLLVPTLPKGFSNAKPYIDKRYLAKPQCPCTLMPGVSLDYLRSGT